VAAHVGAGVDDSLADEIDEFLSHLVRARDLVFRGDAHTWLFVLACDEAELPMFSERIEKARVEANRNRPGAALPEIQFESLTTRRNGGDSGLLTGMFASAMDSPLETLHA